jgi:hypothetical protein
VIAVWQVAVRATIMGFVFYAWARHVHLPSGRTEADAARAAPRLPMITAAVPGRAGIDFTGVSRGSTARVLAIPLPAGFQIRHAVLAGAI